MKEKKRPFVIAILVMLSFAIIAVFNSGITGYTVYEKLSSIFSGNTLSAVGGPIIILTVIITISVIALKKITKD
ncbi:hypothetical protein GOV06_01955 [Candidatus Woesearchaeota archaeon]|nr:hypothetical protein [Candidatus Woesearchaeota archaeon]